jgi:hypothetical protein
MELCQTASCVLLTRAFPLPDATNVKSRIAQLHTRVNMQPGPDLVGCGHEGGLPDNTSNARRFLPLFAWLHEVTVPSSRLAIAIESELA